MTYQLTTVLEMEFVDPWWNARCAAYKQFIDHWADLQRKLYEEEKK